MLTSRSNGGTSVTSLAVEQDAPARRQLEAGDHPQRRGLARAGRPEHREELAVADRRDRCRRRRRRRRSASGRRFGHAPAGRRRRRRRRPSGEGDGTASGTSRSCSGRGVRSGSPTQGSRRFGDRAGHGPGRVSRDCAGRVAVRRVANDAIARPGACRVMPGRAVDRHRLPMACDALAVCSSPRVPGRRPAPVATAAGRPARRARRARSTSSRRTTRSCPTSLDLVPGETVLLHVVNGGLEIHEAVIGDRRVQDAWEAAEAAHGRAPPGPTPVVSVPPDVAGLRDRRPLRRARRPRLDGAGRRRRPAA